MAIQYIENSVKKQLPISLNRKLKNTLKLKFIIREYRKSNKTSRRTLALYIASFMNEWPVQNGRYKTQYGDA